MPHDPADPQSGGARGPGQPCSLTLRCCWASRRRGGEHPVDEDGPEDHLPHRAGGVLGDGVDVDPGHTQDPFRVGAHASLVDPGYSSRSRRTTPGTHTWAAELKEAPPRAPHPLSLSPFETAAGGLLRERVGDGRGRPPQGAGEGTTALPPGGVGP